MSAYGSGRFGQRLDRQVNQLVQYSVCLRALLYACECTHKTPACTCTHTDSHTKMCARKRNMIRMYARSVHTHCIKLLSMIPSSLVLDLLLLVGCPAIKAQLQLQTPGAEPADALQTICSTLYSNVFRMLQAIPTRSVKYSHTHEVLCWLVC